MTLKVEGDPGYGSAVGRGFSLSGSLGESETLPLLIPEAESNPNSWKPLNREQLEAAAGGPGWKKFRSRLVLLFWLAWLIILSSAVVVISQSPRPVTTPLHWWQKELFYRLQPELLLDAENSYSSAISKVSDSLPYFRSLGVGVLILEGMFRQDVSLTNLTEIDQQLGTSAQFLQLITDCREAGVRIILDFCKLDLLRGTESSNETEILSNASAHVQNSMRYWLEQGVSGFGICDTDSAFSQKTLTEWRGLIDEFSTEFNERYSTYRAALSANRQIVVHQGVRIILDLCKLDLLRGTESSNRRRSYLMHLLMSRIVMVREMGDSYSALNMSRPAVNSSLVELVSRSLLPSSSYQLSAADVAETIESRLKTLHGEWPSWTVDGEVEWDLQKVLMVLMMTLPGTPVIRYGDEISQAVNVSVHLPTDVNAHKDTEQKSKRSTSLFKSLSRSHSREEALLYGSFIFLPFNSSAHLNSTAMPPLAFLRSWGCVHVLVLLNLGSEPHSLDPGWIHHLPEEGVFVASTGLDRIGSVFLQSIMLQPREATVIKLFEPGSYF